MSLNREVFQDFLDEYADGSTDNIDYIVTTNSDIIRMAHYKKKGSGVNWVDKDLGNGEYRTGVELYRLIPPSASVGFTEGKVRVITFIAIDAIDRIAVKSPEPPSWAFVPPVNP